MRAYFSARAKGVPYKSEACYGLPGTPKWPLESYIVVVLTGVVNSQVLRGSAQQAYLTQVAAGLFLSGLMVQHVPT